VGTRETSIRLAKESQYSAGADDLIDSVTEYLKRETGTVIVS
jgi:hypothetical protein